MSKEHHYTNGEVTIIWKPDLCIHSTRCWRGLSGVFRPGERPWIKPEGAGTAAIKAQIDRCPSGALSYRMNSAVDRPPHDEGVPITEVELLPDGPLMVKDRCVVRHSDGRVEERVRTTAFCRCGASATKPYCDGSHRRTGFTDKEQAS